MATLREQLEGKTREERHALKAQWFASLPTRTFTRGPFSVTLSDFAIEDGRTFSVFVVVLRNGVEILRDTFKFVNPPILVPDGTFRQELTERPGGETFMQDVPNYKEDLVEALKTILIDAIRSRLQI